jgi:hypothetical protein
MQDVVKQGIFIFLLVGIPGVIGGRLAWNRGRNFIGWTILCGLCAMFLLVIWYQKPLREVKGAFRQCPKCREWIKWKDTKCKYCGTELPPAQ